MSVSIANGVVAITGPSVSTLDTGPLTNTYTVGATIVTTINWKEVI